LQRKLISRRDEKPRSGVLKLKKRHVEEATCLPTKGMATACWAFIVAKRTGRETAPALVSRPLQPSNKDFIHMLSTSPCGSPVDQIAAPLMGCDSIAGHRFPSLVEADFSGSREQSPPPGKS
jgi:hypothetical protein